MSPHCMGILGLDCDERFTVVKLNWDCEGGRELIEGTSYYRGDYIYANQKLCINNREHGTLLYNKGRYMASNNREGGQGPS